MSAVDLPEEEWRFQTYLNGEREYSWDELLLIHAYEFSREICKKYPSIYLKRTYYLELNFFKRHPFFFEDEQFPFKPWFQLDESIREQIYDEYWIYNTSFKPSFFTITIDVRLPNSAIERRADFHRDQINKIYDDVNENVLKYGLDSTHRFEHISPPKGGQLPFAYELCLLGCRRLIEAFDDKTQKAARYYHHVINKRCLLDKAPVKDKKFTENKKHWDSAFGGFINQFPDLAELCTPRT